MKILIFSFLLIFESVWLAYIVVCLQKPGVQFWPAPKDKTNRNYYLMIWFYLFLLGIIYLSILESDNNLFEITGLPIISSILLILGLCLYFWCQLYLSKKQGFGFTGSLITTGPYRYIRNPIYVADTLIFLGYALLCNSTYLFIISIIVVTILLLMPLIEEPWLKEQHGIIYNEYFEKIPRFFPNLF